MRIFLLLALAGVIFPFTACTPKDPDLDVQPSVPPTSTNRIPWNKPVSGQGGGAMGGAMQNQPRR